METRACFLFPFLAVRPLVTRARGRAFALVVVFLLYSIADVTLRSSACLRTRSCSFAEELGQSILGALWLVASGYCIIAGWRGQLLGARRRPADPPIEESSV